MSHLEGTLGFQPLKQCLREVVFLAYIPVELLYPVGNVSKFSIVSPSSRSPYKQINERAPRHIDLAKKTNRSCNTA